MSSSTVRGVRRDPVGVAFRSRCSRPLASLTLASPGTGFRPARNAGRAILVALAVALALPVAAGTRQAEAEAPQLRHDLAVDLPVTLAGAALWLGSEFALKQQLSPAACRWCDRDEDGADGLNGLDRRVRRGLRWTDTHAAGRASDALLFVGVPATTLGLGWLAARHDGRAGGYPVDALVVLQATVLSADLNQIVKFAVARQRPCAHFDGDCGGSGERALADRNLSFYSGHASVSFTLATASGTVASMRGYRRARWIWGAGLALAATTSYLRIAADRHYLTDVLAGAAVGSAVGVAVPRLLHGQRRSRPAIVPAAVPQSGGFAVRLSLAW
jgi:membrane-associated phospholipid phosphatase